MGNCPFFVRISKNRFADIVMVSAMPFGYCSMEAGPPFPFNLQNQLRGTKMAR